VKKAREAQEGYRVRGVECDGCSQLLLCRRARQGRIIVELCGARAQQPKTHEQAACFKKPCRGRPELSVGQCELSENLALLNRSLIHPLSH
jgi:hypothetical protein